MIFLTFIFQHIKNGDIIIIYMPIYSYIDFQKANILKSYVNLQKKKERKEGRRKKDVILLEFSLLRLIDKFV